MADDDYKDSVNEVLGREWVGRIYGGAVVVFSVVGFFLAADSFGERLWNIVGLGFLSAILVSVFVVLPMVILEGAKNVSEQEKDPFKQGIKFVFFICLALCVFDLILMEGTFLVSPVISILTTGSTEGTYWNCDNWVSYDEGSRCVE